MDSSFPEKIIPEAQRSKRKLLVAILLGFLTFVVTPVTAIIVAVPFFFLGKISENFNPIVVIASIFGLRELVGFFAAQFILIVFLALLGNLGVAVISWFINRSKKLATITFVSALVFQFVSVAIVLPLTMKKSQEAIQLGNELEKSYQQFAKIGNVSFDVQEPYSDIEIGNRHPEYGPMHKKLQILVPILVSQPGAYQASVRYSFSKAGESGSVPMKDVIGTFGVGEHMMQVEYLAHEVSSYGFWSPASVGGVADVQLFYLASEKELLDKIGSNSALDQKILEQFLRDEGLDKREVQTKPTINKFIERKEIHF
ncbi:MAG: hypothetical protein AABY40_02300 [Nanoarchaeota archaeon]